MSADPLLTDLARLARERGGAVTLRRQTVAAYDPETGTAGATLVDSTASALVTGYAGGEIDGSVIQADDRKVTIAALPGVPQPQIGDALVIAARTYRVVNSRAVGPTGAPIAFIAQARK